ncbi:hypothetical protein DYB32_001370 [Aphanomyces invadans]|uniref:Cell morphogenesis protein C-terminal domain-containing protein n=1 Tax=Aphanomyces invadans TaxID=157072 RepID=A0A3R6Z9I8_9STRA|nr:hypothetical protein DYB32_001370 [Aphanomyces invadans]
MDDLVGILKRELDEFMATHASTVLSNMGEERKDDVCLSEVERIGTMWAVMASRNFAVAIDTLLEWQSGRLDGSLFGHVGLWLTGHVLRTVLRNSLNASSDSPVWDTLIAAAFNVLSEWNRLESCVGANRSFFGFNTTPSKPTNDFLLQEAVHNLWKENFGLMGTSAIRSIKQHFLNDLEHLAATGVTKESYINNFSTLRLCLIRPHATFDAAAQASTSFLRILTSCTHKVHKPTVRLVALQVLAAILTRELTGLSTAGLRAYHDVNGCDAATTADWTSLLGDLHAIGVKQSMKKRFSVVAWHLRLAVLMLSNADMFCKWWKVDAQALLQAYGQHNASIPFLHLVELLLRHLIKRHVAASTAPRSAIAPADADVMEIVNAIQAWCFTNSKHKTKKMRVIFSVLSRLSLCIAAYNMPYALDNHIHHLIVDANSIYEVRRLVGLQSLWHVLQHTGHVHSPTMAAHFSLVLDSAALAQALPALGDVVNHVLMACRSHLDAPIRSGKANEFKHWIATQTLEAAIYCTQVLYSHMTFDAETKLHLLIRSAIHDEECLRIAGAGTLSCLARTLGDSSIFRALVACTLQSTKAGTTSTLVGVLHSIIQDPAVPTWSTLDSDLEPVEALGLILLCHAHTEVRRGALKVLDAVRALRQGRLQSTKINAMDIVTGIDGDLQKTLGLQAADKHLALEAGGVIQWLARTQGAEAQPSSQDIEWLWSLSLTTLFPRLCEICPNLIDHVWTAATDRVFAIEPHLPDDDNADVCTPSQWRNLSIFVCATATATKADVVGAFLQHQSKYLSSLSLDQRISATLALSSTHSAAHVELLERLSTMESQAFPDKRPLQRGLTRKDVFAHPPSMSKQPAVLQWVLARCVRSLVQHRIQLWSNGHYRDLVLRVVDKLYAALTTQEQLLAQPNGWRWWIRLEFCAMVESIVHQNNLLAAAVEADDDGNAAAAAVVTTATREQWFVAMWQWCSDQRTHTAPSASSVAMLLPCYSMPTDETSWQLYELTKRAYRAMAMLMVGPVFNDPAPCFAWMDGSFAVGMDEDLQAIVASGLRLLVHSDPGGIIPQTIDRCFFVDAASCAVATQYLHVVASIAVDLRDEFEANRSCLCELLFVALLHLSTPDDRAAVHILVTMGQDRDVVPHAFQPHNAKATTTRQLQLVTKQIALRWASHSVDVLQVMLSYVAKCTANPTLQTHVMAHCSPWVHQLDVIDRQCMSLLFRLTHDHVGALPSLSALWLDVCRAKDYRHVPTIVAFLFGLATREKLDTAKRVLNWMSASPMDSQQLIRCILNYAQDGPATFATSCVTVLLLSALAVSQVDDATRIVVAHRVFSVLHMELHDRATCHDEMFTGVEEDGLALVQAMVHNDSSMRFLSLQNAIQEYLASVVPPLTDAARDRVEPTATPVALFESLVDSFCRHALTDSQQSDWVTMAVDAFTSERFDARFGLLLYRVLRPPFDGGVCIRVMDLLTTAIDSPDLARFLPDYLVTLTSIAAAMPDAKLVLYPQLLWITVALLHHNHYAFQLPALHLLNAFVTKATFHAPIVQDMLEARRPSALASSSKASPAVSVDILLAACRHVDSQESADVVRSIVRAVLGSTVDSKLHCVLCTAVLLPQLSLCNPPTAPSNGWSIRQELGFLWRVQHEAQVADIFLAQDGTEAAWHMSHDLGRLLMAGLSNLDEEKAFFDTLLVILNGRCDHLKRPTLELLQKMVQAAPEHFWKRNTSLLAALTRIMRTTNANDAAWPVLVSVLSTLLPCP